MFQVNICLPFILGLIVRITSIHRTSETFSHVHTHERKYSKGNELPRQTVPRAPDVSQIQEACPITTEASLACDSMSRL